MKFPNLYGDRINLMDLTEIGEKGLKDMFEYSQDCSFYKYMEYEPHQSIEETRQYLNKLIKRSKSDTAHYWFIFLKSEKKIIGTFGVLNIDKRKGCAEIGYGLSSSYWGRGYFYEALVMVLKLLFLDFSFHRVSAITQIDNLASIKALKKIGFKKEGTMRDFYLSYKDKHRYDAVIMSILKYEFLQKFSKRAT